MSSDTVIKTEPDWELESPESTGNQVKAE
jgi:hypothetical protein